MVQLMRQLLRQLRDANDFTNEAAGKTRHRIGDGAHKYKQQNTYKTTKVFAVRDPYYVMGNTPSTLNRNYNCYYA